MPQAAMPGGQVCAAVIVKGDGEIKVWSATVSKKRRLPGCALASICTCAAICAGEITCSFITAIPCDGLNWRPIERGAKLVPLKVMVTVEPAAPCAGVKLIRVGVPRTCACTTPHSARHAAKDQISLERISRKFICEASLVSEGMLVAPRRCPQHQQLRAALINTHDCVAILVVISLYGKCAEFQDSRKRPRNSSAVLSC